MLSCLVVPEVDESVACNDAPVPIANELNLELFTCKPTRATREQQNVCHDLICRGALQGCSSGTRPGTQKPPAPRTHDLIAERAGTWYAGTFLTRQSMPRKVLLFVHW